MANIYLKILSDAKQLPAAYRAMGTGMSTLIDTRRGTTFSGWGICQFLYKMNEDGDEWWSNDFRLLVDTSGSLWEAVLAEQYEPHATPSRTSSVSLDKVDGEKLRMWHTNGWDFAKMKRSIEAML
ncbi:hypothetical protein I1A62_37025 [Rhodococcus sp. USK10]|uniref:hypothetical protein n=1 Tax=Rhodococcus sp. USK10 TaxID=2789739 RepID=UPI001C607929|nr:hypothetical protein [Rhodococcus sp. USK10]QYB02738.1 hypothetical protein I1A62_37025 [Rhodococcus sp. USK10]